MSHLTYIADKAGPINTHSHLNIHVFSYTLVLMDTILLNLLVRVRTESMEQKEDEWIKTKIYIHSSA